MSTPIVTEIKVQLEPVTRDTFIDGLADPARRIVVVPTQTFTTSSHMADRSIELDCGAWGEHNSPSACWA